MDDEHEARWSVQRSADLYQIRGWGHPYFTINEAGHVQVVPDPERPQQAIDLFELANGARIAHAHHLDFVKRFQRLPGLRDSGFQILKCLPGFPSQAGNLAPTAARQFIEQQ